MAKDPVTQPKARGRTATSAPRERRDTAELLLRAAEAEIADNGTGDVSLRAIARRAGVSHQAPGFVYGDRLGLLTALAVKGSDQLVAVTSEMLGTLPENADAAARLQAVGIAYVTFAERHPGMFGVMMNPELHRADDPDVQAAKAQSFGLLVEALQDVQSEGWAAESSLESLTLLCWSVVHGVVALVRDGTLGTMIPGMSGEEAARRVTDAMAVILRSADEG